MAETPVFVAREHELARLSGYLEKALANQGQVCFVIGEAGAGKTALVTEFARRAQETHTDLLVAIGDCDAQTGIGDPYLPFREVLSLLTGDVATKPGQAPLTEENASRLRSFLRVSGQALVELGPDLIDIFVPGAGLATRAAAMVAGKVGWLDRLEGLTARRAGGDGDAELEQSHIFEQYTNVLKALASQQPLLLVLDDLQWADTGSTSLLFHLGRRLGESRILLVGTYRPDDVALGRGGERHPLEPVVNELRRYYGDILLDLGRALETEGRQFVDALLDTEPNRLGEAFRQALFRHTGGHPLFTVELVRHMQEQSALVRDEEGYWVEGPDLDWSALPARVEGVIEERIGRLDEEARESLTVASVEGEEFTAQVVARVRDIDERRLVRRLSRELDKQLRLVQTQGTARINRRRLSLYRFRHNLFQRYLYDALDEVEREFVHEDVGAALEELYGEQTYEIAPQLARHFLEAGEEERALPYVIQAGHRARDAYANEDALAYYSRALGLLEQLPGGEEGLEQRFKVLAAREEVCDRLGRRDMQRADLADMVAIAEELGNHRWLSDSYNRLSWFHINAGEFPRAKEMAEQALGTKREIEDRAGEADALRNLGVIQWYLGNRQEALPYFQEALEIARDLGDRKREALNLNSIAVIHDELGDNDQALSCYEEALRIAREIGARRMEARGLGNLGSLYQELGSYYQALMYHQQALQLSQQIGDRQKEGLNLGKAGLCYLKLGNYQQALRDCLGALEIFSDIGFKAGVGHWLENLGAVHLHLRHLDEAFPCLQKALSLAQEIGLKDLVAQCNITLALSHLQQGGEGNLRTALALAAEAAAMARELSVTCHEIRALSVQAMAHLSLGESGLALKCSAEAVRLLETGLHLAESVEEVYFRHFLILRANGREDEARTYLDKAFEEMMAKAEMIEDEQLKQSFLLNVAVNREIQEAWEALKESTN